MNAMDLGDPDPSNHRTKFSGADDIVEWFSQEKTDDWRQETDQVKRLSTIEPSLETATPPLCFSLTNTLRSCLLGILYILLALAALQLLRYIQYRRQCNETDRLTYLLLDVLLNRHR